MLVPELTVMGGRGEACWYLNSLSWGGGGRHAGHGGG